MGFSTGWDRFHEDGPGDDDDLDDGRPDLLELAYEQADLDRKRAKEDRLLDVPTVPDLREEPDDDHPF